MNAAVNAIYIATPPDSHEAYTLAAINAGKPVYVEKPMAVNAAAAKNMAAVAKEKNIKLAVAHYRREQPIFKKIKQLINDEVVGPVRLVRLELYKPPLTQQELGNHTSFLAGKPCNSRWWPLSRPCTSPAGSYVLLFLARQKKVNGIATNQSGNYAADDLVAGSIQFKNGVVFSGTWCFNAAATTDNCEIIGSNGSIYFSVFGGNTITVIAKGVRQIFSFDALEHVQQPMIEK